ncbi:MAG: NAD-dependent epimerase/dehydratase family protein [Candidatus Dormibacteria bacterium]
MRLLVTGGSGVLGRVALPRLISAGHDVAAPPRTELNLFNPYALREAMADREGILHLASRIPPAERMNDPDAWVENDHIRSDGTRLVVSAALKSNAQVVVLPSAVWLPERNAVPPELQSLRVAETQIGLVTRAGRRGVVVRLGLLWGPGTGNDTPNDMYGATLHVDAAAEALVGSLDAEAGVYRAIDGELSPFPG